MTLFCLTFCRCGLRGGEAISIRLCAHRTFGIASSRRFSQ